MSKKISQFSVEDPLEPDQADQSTKAAPTGRKKSEPGQRNGETASSSPESGSLNGDGKRSGKSRRRKKRSSNPESHPEGKADVKNEDKPDKQMSQPPDQCATLVGLQSECANVWFERSVYERAESLYQCWLMSSSNISSPQSSGKCSNTPSTLAPSSSGLACHHGDQVACHHVEQAVWVNKTTFDQAERRFIESMQPSIPNSLDLPPLPNRSVSSTTPDEGYQSLAPTPATPILPESAVTPTAQQSINGLPCIPVELVRDVWLDKPLYDRAEAAFYQTLYGNNSSKRSSCTSTSRGSDHPQSLVEEEEEEEEDEEVVVEEKRVVPQGKVEIFHALHPIQEEEEPVEIPEGEEASGTSYFLHPDSERVWLDKWRYDAAESRFCGSGAAKACAVKKDQRQEAPSVASKAPRRDKKMSMVDFLAQEKIWFDKPRYDEAERLFYERMNGSPQNAQDAGANTILQDIARARENIQKSLAGSASSNNAADQGELVSRIKSLELENQSLHKVVEDLRSALSKLECRVAVLEKSPASVAPAPSLAPAPSVRYTNVRLYLLLYVQTHSC
ncbi:eukaryotic translation elongation factor 1 delta b (guanine nucleotide exchange protein) isoform X2 [Melanotaenia boesemani]|uniref:eukaryotic translation elongation factor 1 delta b (guanine nucleotide exchange protein) isoform X2 n=1 Tax=Melanotaenia boesemani TaxID=1250792 RepID=UPI001C03A556|nr:eukaryotic translation elongation factor 1 delta b (guanine nucleotide exchange protein) isoform X2 [Melanotaenia boesemani]